MANFEIAFQRLMRDEGFVLTNDPVDRGGQTYGGVSRKAHPQWVGWKFVDAGDTPPTDLLREFYREKFWNKIHGDHISGQRVAEVIFGQYANMGMPAIKLVQECVGVIADGKFGEKTLGAVHKIDEENFLMRYALANIARYHGIGMNDKTQRKWWPGWIARGLRICK